MKQVKLEKIQGNYLIPPEFTKEDVEQVLDKVKKIVDHMLLKFHDDAFPRACSINYVYSAIGNLDWRPSINVSRSNWTNSFWTGILWLMYEYTHID